MQFDPLRQSEPEVAVETLSRSRGNAAFARSLEPHNVEGLSESHAVETETTRCGVEAASDTQEPSAYTTVTGNGHESICTGVSDQRAAAVAQRQQESSLATATFAAGTTEIDVPQQTERSLKLHRSAKLICYRNPCVPECRLDHLCNCPDLDTEYSHLESDHDR